MRVPLENITIIYSALGMKTFFQLENIVDHNYMWENIRRELW